MAGGIHGCPSRRQGRRSRSGLGRDGSSVRAKRLRANLSVRRGGWCGDRRPRRKSNSPNRLRAVQFTSVPHHRCHPGGVGQGPVSPRMARRASASGDRRLEPSADCAKYKRIHPALQLVLGHYLETVNHRHQLAWPCQKIITRNLGIGLRNVHRSVRIALEVNARSRSGNRNRAQRCICSHPLAHRGFDRR
jgi:hypothetical protein